MSVQENSDRVTMKGKPITLMGALADVRVDAPAFRVVDDSFKPVNLSDFRGKVVLISAVPSLDTGVCSLQTKRFNEEAAKLPADVVILTISMDLPFAQKRFCETDKIGRIRILSDAVWREFGDAYGIRIKDMGLLSRSVWVVGRNGKLLYRQLVPELTTEPDYDGALKAATAAAEKN